MADVMKVWQCIGCGRIDHPQPCVGICQDRKVEIVYASELVAAEKRVAALESVVRRIAFTHPRAGEEKSTWEALQVAARQSLAANPG